MTAATVAHPGWRRVDLPATSALAARAGECDHVDSVRFDLERPVNLDVALNVLGAPLSGVMGTAMRLRNGIVGRFGLKTSDAYRPGDPRDPISCLAGERIGSFTIFERSVDEAIVGKDDRHLDFRVSMLVEETAVIMTTMVFFRNVWGRRYFAVIRPFHLALVPRSYARALRQLDGSRGPATS